MISITLLGFLMIGVYTMMDNSQTSKDRILSEDQDFTQAMTAMNRLKIDFSQIYSPLYFSSSVIELPQSFTNNPDRQFEGVTSNGDLIPRIFNPNSNTLIFMSFANRRKIQDSKESRWAWMQYTLRRHEESDPGDNIESGTYKLVRLVSKKDVFSNEIDWSTVRRQTLLKNVKELIFEFWDADKEKWLDNLRDLEHTKRYKLSAVKVTLKWFDKTGLLNENVQILRPLWPYFKPETKNNRRKSIIR